MRTQSHLRNTCKVILMGPKNNVSDFSETEKTKKGQIHGHVATIMPDHHKKCYFIQTFVNNQKHLEKVL